MAPCAVALVPLGVSLVCLVVQANVLSERNKRAALETETEDTQRQLKRSMAKVAALGRDREEREIKLRAKQVNIHVCLVFVDHNTT